MLEEKIRDDKILKQNLCLRIFLYNMLFETLGRRTYEDYQFIFEDFMYGNNIFDLIVKKSDGKSEKIKVKAYI